MIEKKNDHVRLYFWCLSFLKRYVFFVIAYMLLVVIQQIGFACLPMVLGKFIDLVVLGQRYDEVSKMIMALLCIVAIIIFSRIIYAYCGMVFSEKGTKVIQYEVVDKIRRLGVPYFEKTARGKIISETFQNIISIYFIYSDFLPNTFHMFFGFLIPFILIVSTKNIPIIILSVIAYMIISLIVLVFSRKLYKKNIELRDQNNLFYQETFSAIEAFEEIKGYSGNTWIHSVLNSRNKLIMSLKRKYQGIQELHTLLMNVVTGVITICFLLVYLLEAKISYGNMVSGFLLLNSSISALSSFLQLLIRQNRNLTDAEKPYEFLRNEVEYENTDIFSNNGKKISGKVSVRGIGFSYEGKEPIIDCLSMEIMAGEKVVIVGKSGCGKTSLLKLLMGIYHVNEGEILVDDIPIRGYDYGYFRDQISIVFQESYMFSDSVEENIRFAKPQASNEEIGRALYLAEADKFVKELPDGKKSFLHNRGENISGGQRQRLSLARIFLKNPQVYILDEVTSELDENTTSRVIDNIFAETDQKTVIMVSHKLSVIKRFPRIIVIDKGKVVEDGTFAELYNEGSFFYQLISEEVLLDD